VPRIDLHTHSTSSDGTDTPAQLPAAAAAADLDVLAITDHDNTGGWAIAEAARPVGMTLVRGAEFSTRLGLPDGRTVSVHLLGYLFDPEDSAVIAEQDRLRQERYGRGLAIVDRMVADGVPVSREQLLAIAGEAPVGRPHIGQALMAAGMVASVTEAFDSYLAHTSPYYVRKLDTPIESAIAMIKAAGGVSVVAHGRSRGAARALTAERFTALAATGLNGIEVDHPDHDAAARSELTALADDLDLIKTGSSDYHGTNKILTLGQCTTDAEQFERIVATATGVPLLGPGAA